MILDLLEEGAPDCPLVRLYGFTSAEAGDLHLTVKALAAGQIQSLLLSELDYVETPDHLSVRLVSSSRSDELIRVGRKAFECHLTGDRWARIADLIAPFCVETLPGTFQWLLGGWQDPHDQAPPPSLLFSVDGSW